MFKARKDEWKSRSSASKLQTESLKCVVLIRPNEPDEKKVSEFEQTKQGELTLTETVINTI